MEKLDASAGSDQQHSPNAAEIMTVASAPIATVILGCVFEWGALTFAHPAVDPQRHLCKALFRDQD